MSKAPPQKDPTNFVHQNAIHRETILKETKHQKLYTNYSINPYNKMHAITGKPNSMHDTDEGEEDEHFLKVIKRAHMEPVRKNTFPQTEAEEIGWITKPMIDTDRSDRRLYFPRQNSEITKYMDALWRYKEQTENLN
ncbi:protein FAM183B-like [Lingula anatina]|uniref:Protein FAM183B-like n=1 Tax=Lingula anatina TaxID=7574 RepID=A0A1S3JG85_LINAN|nr:protein FAM183B-like [Lingula anatina]|eukprot:XP_013409420.1 protein FAM183B-like [Lingula anatina]